MGAGADERVEGRRGASSAGGSRRVANPHLDGRGHGGIERDQGLAQRQLSLRQSELLGGQRIDAGAVRWPGRSRYTSPGSWSERRTVPARRLRHAVQGRDDGSRVGVVPW